MSVDLSTKYLGLSLKNPLVIAACPLTGEVEWLKRLQEVGAAAVVLPSLFEEQIEHEEIEIIKAHEYPSESFAEALTYFPDPKDYRTGPENYLDLIANAKKSLSIPVIASLNGTSKGGWVRYGKMLEEAGADALELNVYYIAADVEKTGAEVEQQYVELVQSLKESVRIPLAVKIGPYFSSIGHMAKQIAEAGAAGLVLFNRFLQPDINLDTLETDSRLVLSDPFELLLPLRWVAILHGRVNASLAITSGVHDSSAMMKALLAGADVGMIASVLYTKGFEYVGTMLREMAEWMEDKEYSSVEQLKGSLSQENSPDPEAFARGNYMKSLVSYSGKPV
ncbi:MAG: dihydroorotate dehydrogenase-like protein [Planctomycetota bacterium]